QFAHRLDVIVVRHRKLVERRRAVVVVHAGDFGDDKPRAALGAFLIVIHKHFGRTAVGLTESHHHRRHNYTVFNLASAYFHRRKQHLVLLFSDGNFLFHYLSSAQKRTSVVAAV